MILQLSFKPNHWNLEFSGIPKNSKSELTWKFTPTFLWILRNPWKKFLRIPRIILGILRLISQRCLLYQFGLSLGTRDYGHMLLRTFRSLKHYSNQDFEAARKLQQIMMVVGRPPYVSGKSVFPIQIHCNRDVFYNPYELFWNCIMH